MIRPFTDTLRDLRAGKTLDELAERLQEIVQAVQRCGKQGTLTLKLTIKPASRGDLETILIHDAIKAIVPEGERAATLFFGTPEGNLTRTNPRQIDGLRGVDDEVEVKRKAGGD